MVIKERKGKIKKIAAANENGDVERDFKIDGTTENQVIILNQEQRE